MTDITTPVLDAHYRRSFGTMAGYLPQDRSGLATWHAAIREKAATLSNAQGPGYANQAVQDLANLIDTNGIVRMYVTEAIDQTSAFTKNIASIQDMLAQLDVICTTAPEYNVDKNARVLFPMSALFVDMMATPAGKALFRLDAFNEALRAILKTWSNYLDSPASCWVLNRDADKGWLGTAAIHEFKLADFVIDWDAEHGGFQSYNAFFHREIQASCRPLAGEGDANIITSPNDGTVYRIATNVQQSAVFWIKEQNYSLQDMLANPGQDVLQRFVGGTVVQIFLSGADYHRWHAPVDGVVTYEDVDGLLFSENEDNSFDPDAGVTSQVYGAAVNNRGIVSIAADDARLGTVFVMPIGITEISSLTQTAANGQHVSKGDELGYFNYGGSTLCLVFEKDVQLDFGTLQSGQTIEVNAQLAKLNTPGGR
ncbi:MULTISPECIES: phophatidylserine decarboxylase associated domain-containing protein [unclassified Xanthomonas]|uniref:phophatidylserine decarboxylase associated domain-containing protein n=1 Tax=unclassified Xanthomonas TaxID=2643310 RepID=UPI002B23DF9E|nr:MULTISPECIES: phophatidylserine decarboxylase associated domain-containing protein [unclassified Xanthomonas]MEA9562701.1 phophatidylserine decarboxylase associated domain-containing protein [Xanthomonas sp. WHRI 8932A]MEA9633754.1 phophatidylserine decarboxylase associated domain-containing protein [Xanthomonas sp. WHRI 8812E]